MIGGGGVADRWRSRFFGGVTDRFCFLGVGERERRRSRERDSERRWFRKEEEDATGGRFVVVEGSRSLRERFGLIDFFAIGDLALRLLRSRLRER